MHDQFGPNFTKWAERQRGTWDDCKSSLVVCSGLQPIAVPVALIEPPTGSDFYDLVKVSWQGCGVENFRAERLVLKNVRFKDCYLVGTIFDSIDFVGCSFEGCDLKGGLFRRCNFLPDEKGGPTTFERCDANIAIVGGRISNLRFHDCHLQQAAIDGATLAGEIRYSGYSRLIQGYLDVKRDQKPERAKILFEAGSRAALCLWGPQSHGLLDFKDPDLDKRNSGLDDEFRVRPREG